MVRPQGVVEMGVSITPQGNEAEAPPEVLARARANGPLRTLIAMIVMALAFMAVGAQLVRLALPTQSDITSSLSETVSGSYARPDIVDRNGRLLASDVEAYSLFADPARVLDRDEVVEKLAAIFPDLDRNGVRRDLADTARRFVWIRRGLSPRTAQEVHNLGLPGLDFRRELRRAYPGGTLAGHVLGYVNIDNRGVAGMERYVDAVGVDAVQSATLTERAPVRLSLDLGVQHAVENELADAMRRFEAKGAAGLVLDANTGEVLASASFPDVDPARPTMSLEAARADKIAGSTFELGSVFKTVTLALALEGGYAKLDTVLDVRQPLAAGAFTIRDLHPVGRPLSVAEVFVHSSNIGAAMLATRAGPQKLQAFLHRLGLLTPAQTEEGPIASPQLPARWGQVETMTIAYGHGLALSPLQFAAAASALLNGGRQVQPTFLKRAPDAEPARAVPLISAATSARMRELMRLNVTHPAGTGKRAAVPGYAIGGKTGTADIPGPGGYRERAVISSFLAAFPIDRPKYLVFVLLFEPKPTHAAAGEVLAALNAAPTAGRIIARIGPVLGMMSASATGAAGVAFDGMPAKYEAQ